MVENGVPVRAGVRGSDEDEMRAGLREGEGVRHHLRLTTSHMVITGALRRKGHSSF